MHLKNFSLLTTAENEVMLAPGYDLLSTKLLIPEDTEELALPMNGKKSRFKKSDFSAFAEKLEINAVSIQNVHKKFLANESTMLAFIDQSFLSQAMKSGYKDMISSRVKGLGE
jgi:serine/threonine-protein kinase HipA